MEAAATALWKNNRTKENEDVTTEIEAFVKHNFTSTPVNNVPK